MPPELNSGASSFFPVCLCVTLLLWLIGKKTLTLAITFEALEIETSYLACILN